MQVAAMKQYEEHIRIEAEVKDVGDQAESKVTHFEEQSWLALARPCGPDCHLC